MAPTGCWFCPWPWSWLSDESMIHCNDHGPRVFLSIIHVLWQCFINNSIHLKALAMIRWNFQEFSTRNCPLTYQRSTNPRLIISMNVHWNVRAMLDMQICASIDRWKYDCLYLDWFIHSYSMILLRPRNPRKWHWLDMRSICWCRELHIRVGMAMVMVYVFSHQKFCLAGNDIM